MKDLSQFKCLTFIFIIAFLSSCSLEHSNSLNSGYTARNTDQYPSNYLVPGQLPVPPNISSVQLFRSGSAGNPPIINLEYNQKLVLRFDELADLSGQFRITFSHHDAFWNPSNIPTDWYLEGNTELILGGGVKNKLSEPDYFSYEMTFPNNELNFISSGNFMLHVSDYSSGTELFSMPFYVFEGEGDIESNVETLYNAGPGGAPVDQPFSRFSYPEFVEFPQFDLLYFFVQNRFWGKTRQTDVFDIATPGQARFYLPRNQSFAANMDFNHLNLGTLSQGGQIVEWLPEYTPPRVILREDVLNFSSDRETARPATFSRPEFSRNARYANVRFRFYDGGNFNTKEGVYLTGDFNQWVLNDRNRLKYNSESGYWETEVLLKEGRYSYKYSVKSSRNEPDYITLSDNLAAAMQEYVSLVYYEDPAYNYHRLLKADIFYSSPR